MCPCDLQRAADYLKSQGWQPPRPLDAEEQFIKAWNEGKVRRISDGKMSPDFK